MFDSAVEIGSLASSEGTYSIRKANTHSLNSKLETSQRSALLHAVKLTAARCHGAKSRRRQRPEHIHGELLYSELAARRDDLGVNGGHPAMQREKLKDTMGEDCSILSISLSFIYLYIFKIYHGPQLETGEGATWTSV